MPEPRVPLFHAALFRLELRRALGGGFAPFVLLLVLLLSSAPWGPPEELLDGEAGAAIARGLARQSVWVGALLFLAPALLWRAGGAIGRWRGGEGDWLGSRPTGRFAAVIATWSGTACAGALLLAASAVIVELRTGGDEQTIAYAGSHSLAGVRRIEPGQSGRFRLPDPGEATPAGSFLRARVTVTVGNAGTSDVRLRVERGTSSPAIERTVHVSARTWIDVPLPDGPGDVALTLENIGEGSIALLTPGSFELWAIGGSERDSSVQVATRAALGLAAGTALAFGCGAFVSPITAGLLALLPWIVTALVFGAPGWLPGARLARTLSFVGEGRLPEALDPFAFVGLVVCIALGCALAVSGLRSWRHAS